MEEKAKKITIIVVLLIIGILFAFVYIEKDSDVIETPVVEDEIVINEESINKEESIEINIDEKVEVPIVVDNVKSSSTASIKQIEEETEVKSTKVFKPPVEENLPSDNYDQDILWAFSINNKYIGLTNSSENDRQVLVSIYKDNKELISKKVKVKGLSSSNYLRLNRIDCIDNFDLIISNPDGSDKVEWNINTIMPTCVNKGYTLLSGGRNDSSVFVGIVDALGHDFLKWNTLEECDGVNCGSEESYCQRCNERTTRPLYPNDGFSYLRMYGNIDGIERKSSVNLTGSFYGDDIEFDTFIELKYQGHSSIINDKKNFTIKFFKDESHDKKLKNKFKDWYKESKFILKANYIDSSQARNVVCADIWSEICETRDGTKHIQQLFRYGAVDGFPMAVYLNDEYIGLYTLTLHKDDDLFDLDEGQNDAMVIINHSNKPESLFKEKSLFDDESDWELEFCGTEDKTWAKNQLNDFIDFIMTADDETFNNNKKLKKYMNIDSGVDYLLAMYSLGLTNSYAKNLVMVSYGEDPWIMSMFDMEDAFGLYTDGTGTYDADYMLPSKNDGAWSSNTGSLLWDRLLNGYEDRFISRYAQLRESILSIDNITSKICRYIDAIPNAYYLEDSKLYPNMPQIDAKTQVKNYLEERFALLDKIFYLKED